MLWEDETELLFLAGEHASRFCVPHVHRHELHHIAKNKSLESVKIIGLKRIAKMKTNSLIRNLCFSDTPSPIN